MSSVIDSIERSQLRQGLPSFEPGDRVRVHFQVVEGNRRRTQVFEGIVLRRQGSGVRETFTVRKQSFGVGVERTFPLHSPKIERLEVAGRGDVRRAKLYYLRGRVGKAARVAERRWGIDEELVSTPEAVDAEGVTVTEATGGEAAGDEVQADQAAGPASEEDSSSSPEAAGNESTTESAAAGADDADGEGSAEAADGEAEGEPEASAGEASEGSDGEASEGSDESVESESGEAEDEGKD